MNIVVGSAFRNSRHYLSRYFGQVAELAKTLNEQRSGVKVRVIAAEGDSTDATRHMLCELSKTLPIELRDATHGKRVFGSTEEAERMRALSHVGNTIFDGVTEQDDILIYVESDLLWTPYVMSTLVDSAYHREQNFDVFAPMVFAGKAFYDIWGFRMNNGERFTPFDPYHIALQTGLNEIESAGSCLVMRADVARACRIKNDYCLVGWCEDARANNFKIAVNTQLRVHHP